jgi:hypothetical protein
MKKQELIDLLLASPYDEVRIFDHRKSANRDSGDGPSEAIYDFEVGALNDTLSKEEIESVKEEFGFTPNPFIALFFDNEDFDDEGNDLTEER